MDKLYDNYVIKMHIQFVMPTTELNRQLESNIESTWIKLATNWTLANCCWWLPWTRNRTSILWFILVLLTDRNIYLRLQKMGIIGTCFTFVSVALETHFWWIWQSDRFSRPLSTAMNETPGSLKCFLSDYVRATKRKAFNNRSGQIFVNERHKKRMGIYKEETEDCVEMG